MTALRRDVAAGTLVLIALFAAARLASGFDGLYGQDAHEYLRHARELGAWLRGGPRPGPAFWPPGYPLASALLGLLVPQPLAAQLVSALAWLLGFAAGAVALQRLHPDAGRVGTGYVFLVLGLSPLLARAGFLAMSDLLGLALLLLGLERALAWRDRGGGLRLGAALLALAAAGVTRHATLLMALPLLLWLLARARARPRELALALPLSAVPLVPALLVDVGALWPVQYPALAAWSASNAWARAAPSPDGLQHHPLPQALFALAGLGHPKLMLPGLLLLPFLRRSDFEGLRAALAAGFALHAGFVAGSPYQHDRHLLTGFAWVPLLLYPAWPRLRPRLGPPLRIALALAAAQLAVLGWIARTPIQAWKLEAAAVERLRQEPAVALYTFFLTPALRGRGVPQTLHELWEGDVAQARPGDLVLYAPERFAAQWAGRPPATTFAELQARFVLRPRAELPLGFRLWVLEGRP